MTIGRRRQWIYAVLPLMLAACAGHDVPPVNPNIYPSDYKNDILKMMPQIVADPSNMRDTGISDLALTSIGNAQRYTACVRFNPHKSATEYDGVQERIAIFNGGSLAQFVAPTPEQCGKAVYKPFPELERLCFGEHCKPK